MSLPEGSSNVVSVSEAGGSRNGQVVGEYVIVGDLAHGGMGDIFVGKHRTRDDFVAIKFLNETLSSDPLYVDRFLREAKSAEQLSHPGIVTLLDSGSLDDDVYYLIMEYVHGRNLQIMLCETGIFEVPFAVEVICQAAAALGHAHQAGIIHRDVKPENIVYTTDGMIKVCDLGLAKKIGEDGLITQRGMVMGSPNYMAPERLDPTLPMDLRSDIYSLGATLFHLLTGRIPFEGTPPVIMSKHLSEPLSDPRELRPEIPEGLAAVIQKMMAKNMEDRYATMDEVIEELAPYRRIASNSAE